MKKRFAILATILTFTLVIALPALAAQASGSAESTAVTGIIAQQSGAYVVDNADLLTEQQENTLKSKLASISSRHNCDVVVVTVQSVGSKTPEAFADDFFDYNGYKPDGILLLVSMQDRDWHVSTTGKGISAVNSAALKRIERDVVSELSDARYYNAFDKFGDLCDTFLTCQAQGKPYKESPVSAGKAAIAAIASGLAAGGIGTSSMKRKLKSVHRKTNAGDYVRAGSLNIVSSREMFLFKNVSRVEIQRTSSSSGGGGGTHISSSGVSHGGGGGKF
ncbi:MAG: TPM domain-containing protein [Clostridia bacterium]|nr:TPM domain-containing protein [Clostridia bacterium]